MDLYSNPYKKHRKSHDDSNNSGGHTQSLSLSLIIFVFIVYGCGLLSTILSLPPIKPQDTLPLKFLNHNKSINTDSVPSNGVPDEQQQVIANEFQNDSVVPKSTWPVTMTKSEWYEISHPGDSNIKLNVPPFWSTPIHENKLMTRKRALSVGTCAKPDPTTGLFQRGDLCPFEERTIFVAIASYRDWQCRYTVESIFTRAKYPHRIRVGIVDQIVDGDFVCNEPMVPCEENPDQALCTYIDQVENYVMDAPLSVGPVFARHIGHRLYRGEYYAMQSDAHVTFTQVRVFRGIDKMLSNLYCNAVLLYLFIFYFVIRSYVKIGLGR